MLTNVQGQPYPPPAPTGTIPPGLTPEMVAILTALQGSGIAPGMEVISGARSPSRNAAVGGARGSQHLGGNAVDIKGVTPEQRNQLVEAALSSGAGGIGMYPGGGLHVDARDSPALWGSGGAYSGVSDPTLYPRPVQNMLAQHLGQVPPNVAVPQAKPPLEEILLGMAGGDSLVPRPVMDAAGAMAGGGAMPAAPMGVPVQGAPMPIPPATVPGAPTMPDGRPSLRATPPAINPTMDAIEKAQGTRPMGPPADPIVPLHPGEAIRRAQEQEGYVPPPAGTVPERGPLSPVVPSLPPRPTGPTDYAIPLPNATDPPMPPDVVGPPPIDTSAARDWYAQAAPGEPLLSPEEKDRRQWQRFWAGVGTGAAGSDPMRGVGAVLAGVGGGVSRSMSDNADTELELEAADRDAARRYAMGMGDNEVQLAGLEQRQAGMQADIENTNRQNRYTREQQLWQAAQPTITEKGVSVVETDPETGQKVLRVTPFASKNETLQSIRQFDTLQRALGKDNASAKVGKFELMQQIGASLPEFTQEVIKEEIDSGRASNTFGEVYAQALEAVQEDGMLALPGTEEYQVELEDKLLATLYGIVVAQGDYDWLIAAAGASNPGAQMLLQKWQQDNAGALGAQ